MQSGKIKHWNEDKGYGFIDVDNQSEDVFFHISKARLSQPISEAQQVYFNSERNNKNQLRATEVTSTSLTMQQSLEADLRQQNSNPDSDNRNTKSHRNNRSQQSNRQNQQSNKNNRPSNSNKKSPFSTLFSLIAIIAVAIYFFGDLQSSFFGNDSQATDVTTITTVTTPDSASAITGDAQIDNTIALIKQGGPYPYPNKDGTTFYNREGRLPTHSSGYYREYTVPTPGLSHRGARRIVTGGNPPTVYYLTVDHYDSFSPLQVN